MNIVTISYHSTNIYLIRFRSGWIMIDAGWPDTFFEFLRLLKKKSIKLKEIKYLIVTHFHPDHAGLVQDLKDNGVTLILHGIQIPSIEEINAFFIKKQQANFKQINFLNNKYVTTEESREFLMDLGIQGELVPTPGHSNDSISLVIDGCCAFIGDLPPLELAGGYNDPKMTESWKRLLSYRIKDVYPAHAKVFSI